MSRINNYKTFDVEDHYGVYLKKESLRTLSQPFILTNKNINISKKKNNVRTKKIERNKIKYKDFIGINEIFNEYLTKLKGTMNISNFLNKIYMAELSGAKVRISGNKYGIIVEERMNSIIVVFEDDTVKTYLKGSNDFIIEHDGIEYVFIGSKMKINRFIKK